MRRRIRQFVAALTAKITPADVAFVAEHLNSVEQTLFWRMAAPDQRHALNVVHTALAMAQQYPGVDTGVLLKAALLHDIGKIRGDISTADKIITVLVDRLNPRWCERIARPGRGGKLANLRHAFYIYRHHGERGAEMAARAGVPAPVCDLIRRHHGAAAPGDPAELTILRAADECH